MPSLIRKSLLFVIVDALRPSNGRHSVVQDASDVVELLVSRSIVLSYLVLAVSLLSGRIQAEASSCKKQGDYQVDSCHRPIFTCVKVVLIFEKAKKDEDILQDHAKSSQVESTLHIGSDRQREVYLQCSRDYLEVRQRTWLKVLKKYQVLLQQADYEQSDGNDRSSNDSLPIRTV